MPDMDLDSPDSEVRGSPSPVLVIKACDMCRKKKIKCEPTGQTCQQCIKYRTMCHFTPISTKRAARRPAGHKRVEELEKRLKSMEESLKRANEQAQPQTTGLELVHVELPSGALQNELPSTSFTEQIFSQNSGSTMFNTAPVWGTPTMNDVESFAHHIASPEVSGLGPEIMPMWKITSLHSLFSHRVFKPIPSKPQILSLAKISFSGFNSAFPIFDEDVFTANVSTLDTSPSNPAWWACLNVVLALAHRFRVMEMYENDAEERQAWEYFQNALGVVNELNLLPPSLMAVQALLGMAIVVQGTPNPAPFTFLNSSAMKMCHRLGLHRRVQDGGLTPADLEQRRRVFWIAYTMDKDACIRTGEPPTQSDDDMDVELPEYCSGSYDHLSGNNFFRLRLQLAMIQGQTYRRLLSVRASRQSVAERVVAVRDLEGKLERWKAGVPLNYQQEYTSEPTARADVSRVLHSVILRLTYFHALQAIYRYATPLADWKAKVDYHEEFFDPAMAHEPPAPITCIEEARKALRLLLVTPQGDFACIWVVLHIFVSATTTLLTNILASPSDPRAQSDLQLIEPLLRLLGLLSMKGKSLEVEGMYENCRTMWEFTRKKVWEARGRAVPSKRRDMLANPTMNVGKAQERESIEEFILRIESITGNDDGVFEYVN